MNKTIYTFLQNGELGIWIALPITKDDFQKAISDIGAKNSNAITIGKYESEVAALSSEILANANLDLVNYLAARLETMDSKELDKLHVIMQSSFRYASVEEIIDYTYNTDFFLFRSGINNSAELGRYYVYETGLCQMPDEWKGGIDFERFGNHAAESERGVFTTKGYLMPSGDEWQLRLDKYGVPNQYRLHSKQK